MNRSLPITTFLAAAIAASGIGAAAAQELPFLPGGSHTINGAGATFPFPLIDKWRVEYGNEYPGHSLNYQSIGSGGGIKQHIEKTVNFAATDAPMTISEAELAPDTLHIPETIGGVVIAYNVPEIPEPGLRLDGETIARIFLGEITMWDDPAIAATNPDLGLPSAEIVPARRSDGSGTTFVFTDYLATQSDTFEREIGIGKSVPWPVGVGAAGNEGVAGVIRSTEYSIGYIELAYAFQTGIPFAHVQNGDATAFVEPTLETIAAASSGALSALPSAHESWEGVSIVNAPGPDSYPLSSFTYLLLYGDLGEVAGSLDEARVTVHMLSWMLTAGQSYSESLLYVPLPPAVADIGLDALYEVRWRGTPVWVSADSKMDGSQEPLSGGGCLVATAAFGSELAPQVQALREVRDSTLLSTASGTAFMAAFNEIYYSFSPDVADVMRDAPPARDAVRALITPMLASLSLVSLAGEDSEAGVVALGAAAIALNAGLYVALPAYAGARAWRALAGRRG